MRKKRRKPIYKPDYAGVHQIAVAKRIVGVLLVLTLIAGIAALAVTWAVPSIFRALQPSPIKQEEKEQAIIEELEAEGDSVVRDPETDLPLFENDVNLFLISEEYPDDGSYAPMLETVAGIEADRRIVPAIRLMIEDALEEGVELGFVSGYVSYEDQKALYEKEVSRLQTAGHTKIMSYTYAKDTVSAPGESDMQTGLCIVLKGKEDTFQNSDACRWLENNMGKYGFVFRYPEGKQTATGEEATKLVLRYVGPENAVVMRRLSMCLEEYVHYLN